MLLAFCTCHKQRVHTHPPPSTPPLHGASCGTGVEEQRTCPYGLTSCLRDGVICCYRRPTILYVSFSALCGLNSETKLVLFLDIFTALPVYTVLCCMYAAALLAPGYSILFLCFLHEDCITSHSKY